MNHLTSYAATLTLLLAACAPGPQQTELEPITPVAEPAPAATPAPAGTPAPTPTPAVPLTPDASASGGAAPAGGEAAAPTADPEGDISISTDNTTFVTSSAGEVNPVSVPAGTTFYLQLEFTDPDGISEAQVQLRNTDDTGSLPRGPFSVASSNCETATASVPTNLTCTVQVAVAPDAQDISQEGETAYAFRPLVTDAAGNSSLAFSWAYLNVIPQ